MVRQFFDESQRPYLAVIDGRFLPVIEIEATIEQESRPLTGFSGVKMSNAGTGQQLLTLTIESPRSAMLRNQYEQPQIFIFSRDNELSVSAVTQIQHEMLADFETRFEITIAAAEWSLSAR